MRSNRQRPPHVVKVLGEKYECYCDADAATYFCAFRALVVLASPCPVCGVAAGERCMTPKGVSLVRFHKPRKRIFDSLPG